MDETIISIYCYQSYNKLEYCFHFVSAHRTEEL